jgi:hypothetical protein
MSTDTFTDTSMEPISTTMHDADAVIDEVDLLVPCHWVSVDPPAGISAVIIDPQPMNGFHANIVMHCIPRPPGATPASVDAYLGEAVAGLTCALTNPEIHAVWVSTPDDGTTTHLPPQQRLMISHTVEGLAVDMVQHHTWREDAIVIMTATVSANPDPELIELIDRSLLSPTGFDGDPASLANFIDWDPEGNAIWTPAPTAERIPHL